MKLTRRRMFGDQQSGAALVTVLLITVLLTIAVIALLSATGKNSRNSTDVLSETKAYYAAESGIQRTLNVLRGNTDTTPTDSSDDINYIKAVTPATSNYSGDPASFARLSGWIAYNYPTTGTPDRVVIGESPGTYSPNSGEAYSIQIVDPDNSGTALTFNTNGGFIGYTVAGGATYSGDAKTIYIPSSTASPRTEIHFTDATSTTVNFTSGTPPNPSLGTFTVTNVGGGVQITGTVKFRVDYRLTAPRTGSVTIWGEIKQASSTAPVLATFLSQAYSLLGSSMELCSAASGGPGCADVTLNLTTNPTSSFYAYVTPIPPFRVKVISTGFGPGGARKQLEAIVQRNFFNGVGPGAGTTMLGPSTPPPGGLPFIFGPGSSNGITYSGGNCATTGCVPSFGLTDPTNLNYVTTHPPGPGAGDPTQMQPPPALLDSNNLPEWQQSPAALDSLVDQLRTTAQNSGRYFVNPTGTQDNFSVGSNSNPPGSYSTGTGITFCEGSCQVAADGGGILVVTGKLTNVGGFSFRGLIIVTGEDGWQRNGAGNGQVIGNIVIAPYNRRSYIPENLSSTFLAPRYEVTGGGTSDVLYNDISGSLDNTSQISDFVLGVAEK